MQAEEATQQPVKESPWSLRPIKEGGKDRFVWKLADELKYPGVKDFPPVVLLSKSPKPKSKDGSHSSMMMRSSHDKKPIEIFVIANEHNANQVRSARNSNDSSTEIWIEIIHPNCQVSLQNVTLQELDEMEVKTDQCQKVFNSNVLSFKSEFTEVIFSKKGLVQGYLPHDSNEVGSLLKTTSKYVLWEQKVGHFSLLVYPPFEPGFQTPFVSEETFKELTNNFGDSSKDKDASSNFFSSGNLGLSRGIPVRWEDGRPSYIYLTGPKASLGEGSLSANFWWRQWNAWTADPSPMTARYLTQPPLVMYLEVPSTSSIHENLLDAQNIVQAFANKICEQDATRNKATRNKVYVIQKPMEKIEHTILPVSLSIFK